MLDGIMRDKDPFNVITKIAEGEYFLNSCRGHFLTNLKRKGKPGAMNKLARALVAFERPMIINEWDFKTMLFESGDFMVNL